MTTIQMIPQHLTTGIMHGPGGDANCDQEMELSCDHRWPAHVASKMADWIEKEVAQTLNRSRLVPRSSGIQLVSPSDILRVNGMLGSGAFSQVTSVLASDGRTYACKHLKPSLMKQPQSFRTAAAELVIEAHMLSCFDHPNVLKVRGWSANGIAAFKGGYSNSFFLLLNQLDETLGQRIDRWVKEEKQVSPLVRSIAHQYGCQENYMEKISIMNDLASALDYVHSKGVIFRDLKPNNIGFIGMQVQLFDFGLSRELPSLDTSLPFEMSGKVGTLRYMAPEVALRQAYNVSADVYSWAMVSYEMMSLRRPFESWTRDMHESLVCVQGYRPDTNDALTVIPTEMRFLLEQAWHSNPSHRPRLSQLMIQLQRFRETRNMVCFDQLNMPCDDQWALPPDANSAPLFSFVAEHMNHEIQQKLSNQLSCDSIGTIDTTSLSMDSLGF